MDTHRTLPTTILPTTMLPTSNVPITTVTTTAVPAASLPSTALRSTQPLAPSPPTAPALPTAPGAPAVLGAPHVRRDRPHGAPAAPGAGAGVDPGELLLQVADHGLGVAEPHIPRLLERAAAAGAGPGLRGALGDRSLAEVLRTRALARITRLLDPARR